MRIITGRLSCVVVLLFISLLLLVHYSNHTLKSDSVSPSDYVAKISDVVNETDHNKLLFMHIPKSGGTALTSILRSIQCSRDPINNGDCCRNPGSCYRKGHRRCSSILGCVSHHPRSDLIDQVAFSVALFREPVARTVSAWFYAGHNPNNDAFQVRPEFLKIRKGRLPRVGYEEYIQMPEYRNVQTRMLGANSFPYRDVEVNRTVLHAALSAVDRLFFVGLQEEWAVSALLLARRMNASSPALDQQILSHPVERSTDISNCTEAAECRGVQGQGVLVVNDYTPERKLALLRDRTLMQLTQSMNAYDITLYQYVLRRFCGDIARHPDLQARMSDASRCASIR